MITVSRAARFIFVDMRRAHCGTIARFFFRWSYTYNWLNAKHKGESFDSGFALAARLRLYAASPGLWKPSGINAAEIPKVEAHKPIGPIYTIILPALPWLHAECK